MEHTQLVPAYDFICPLGWIGHRNLKAGALGIRSVPTILVDRFIVNGAQPPIVFAKALQGRFA
ncbi:hypothetical protein AB1286_26095 [Trinickia sp. NRRL B-1857]|uniref:hypothetical protein n=1 Tax=Trinickia sp. NRRL B-1857 TaxID=3162879 RepID=UPI003D2BB4F7